MAAKSSIADLVYEIRAPLLFAMGWMILGIVSYASIPESPIADAVSLAVRVIIVAVAGFLATFRRKFGLVGAAAAGAIVNFAEHVLVKGGWFLLTGETTAAGGVAISYVMFVWAALLIGAFGGALGIVARRKHAAI